MLSKTLGRNEQMNFIDEKEASKRIKALRTLKGFTQEEMADKLNVSRKVYSKYENKPYSVPIDKLKPLANLLGCKMGDFFVAA